MSSARFPRRARLLTKAHYQHVFSRPERSADPCFTVLARPNGLGHPRLGLAVSRKAARRAVERNRAKRLVRESFRYHQQALGSLDLVVIARPGLESRENRALVDSLGRHWVRLIRRCARSSS